MQQINQTLYGEPKGGAVKQWAVYVDGDKVIVEWGRKDGKLQTKETICTSKNVGRANETTPEEQALLEAESKYRKQLDKYYRATIEEVMELETAGVMLAQDYTKKPHFLEEEFYVSPKLDGLRVKTVFTADGDPVWESRGNKTYPVPEHLITPLKELAKETGFSSFDGEAYLHGVALQKIQSCVKKHNELTPEVEYHIFDLPLLNTTWEDRVAYLTDVNVIIDTGNYPRISVVPQTLTTKAKLKQHLAEELEKGYEGLMMRNPKGLYEFKNKRSNDLLKYKEFFDSEAKVIGCRVDKSDEGVLLCLWNGVQFELKMKGNHKYRSYENQLTLIGSWVNFKYQDLTEAGVPTFAVGMYVRECDENGNPIN